MRQANKRILAVALCIALLIPGTTMTALGREAPEAGCAHDCTYETCAYREGTPCAWEGPEADPAEPGEKAGSLAASAEPEEHVHDEGCGYIASVSCDHVHNQFCGGLEPGSSPPSLGGSGPLASPSAVYIRNFGDFTVASDDVDLTDEDNIASDGDGLFIFADGSYHITMSGDGSPVDSAILVDNGVSATIVLEDVHIDDLTYYYPPLHIDRNAQCTVKLVGDNTIRSQTRGASYVVGVHAYASLTIEGPGSLDVYNIDDSAIMLAEDAGLTIRGGTITATGGTDIDYSEAGGAGIHLDSTATLRVEGGQLTATGGPGADGSDAPGGAGVGGVDYGPGGTVIITGGTVRARGGDGGSDGGTPGYDIGAGGGTGGGSLTLNGGSLYLLDKGAGPLDNMEVQVVSGYLEDASGSLSNTEPVLVVREGGTVIPQGGSLTLEIRNAANYNSPVFRWFLNDIVIPGETGSILTVTEAGRYHVEVAADGNTYPSKVLHIRDSGTPNLRDFGDFTVASDDVDLTDSGNIESTIYGLSIYADGSYHITMSGDGSPVRSDIEVWSANATIIMEDVQIENSSIHFFNDDNATYTLKLVGDNVIRSHTRGASYMVGVQAYASLTIEGPGSLDVYNIDDSAIMLAEDTELTIRGGNITATGGTNLNFGGYGGAGIWLPPSSTLRVEGGKLTATGGPGAGGSNAPGGAGIGGEDDGDGGTVIITGGTVRARGGDGGSGGMPGYDIGAGGGTHGGSLTLDGGILYLLDKGAGPLDNMVVNLNGGTLYDTSGNLGPAPIPITGVSLNISSATLPVGGSETLVATVTPADATIRSVTWSSSDPAVATVDPVGQVTGVSAGNATITVTTEDGGFTATCNITVDANAVAVTGVSLHPGSMTLKVKENRTLTATVLPAGSANQAVTWYSSNPAVATVNGNGMVTAVAAGTAIITVTAVDGGYTATCTVTVTKDNPGDEGGNGGGSTGGGRSGRGSADSVTRKTSIPASAFAWDGNRTLTINHDRITPLGLTKVLWDGKETTAYRVYQGSVLIRFDENFIAGQSAGAHTVRVEFLNHYGETTVAVNRAAGLEPAGDNDTYNPNTGGDGLHYPQTGDFGPSPRMWLGLLISAAAVALYTASLVWKRLRPDWEMRTGPGASERIRQEGRNKNNTAE